MTISDVFLIIATALSPLIAVQVTQFLRGQSDKKERQIWVFKTLMATRAQQLSASHVQALNSISLEFSPSNAKEKLILDIWHQYLDHMSAHGMEPGLWAERKGDLLVELLHNMGRHLHYTFNKTEIKNGIYTPVAHGKAEAETVEMRELIVAVLKGERSLPVKVEQ